MIKVFCTAPINRFLKELKIPPNLDLRVIEYATGKDLIAGLNWCDAHISNARVQIDSSILSEAKNIKYIFQPSIGSENLDKSIYSSKIKVDGLWNQIEFRKNHNTTAELAISLILTAIKNFRALTDDVKTSGSWDNRRYFIRDIQHCKVGIIGFGIVGQGLRKLLKGFGCDVMAYDPYLEDKIFLDLDVQKVKLEQLIKKADIISLHCPLNSETYKMLNNESCANMKQNTVIVNCARGGVVCEEMVLDKLAEKTLGAYAADVLEGENPAGVASHNLVQAAEKYNNLIITPHVGGSSYAYMRSIFQLAFDRVVEEIV